MVIDNLPSYFDSSSDVEMFHKEMEEVKESNSLLDAIMDDKMEEAHSLFKYEDNKQLKHNLYSLEEQNHHHGENIAFHLSPEREDSIMDGQDVAENYSHTTAPTQFYAFYQEEDDMDFEL
ncbi:hypothetical protein KI387_043918 [Taxus chinensis]|uniref:Uncharacterized protein n=1 Tax=Taxus chinensis TaxID=29808 RepID=A0AA38LK46_TAXCH|nr:hypothetical protein KI387_043918 [Taxus chinensis]